MSKADTLLKKAASFEKLALFSDRKAFLQAIAQIEPMPPMSNKNINAPMPPPDKKPEQGIDWHYMRNMYSQTPETDPEAAKALEQPGMHMTQDKITGYAPIPKDVQGMLGRIYALDLNGLPLALDGKIGPETRKAINTYKAQYMPDKSNATDSQVFEDIKAAYTRNIGRYGK